MNKTSCGNVNYLMEPGMRNMLLSVFEPGIRRGSVILVVLFAIGSSAYSGNPDPLFSSDEVVRMELRADFSSIQKNRTENQESFPGELIYYNKEGGEIALPVKVSARGNFRLKPENCSFPPLLVDFKKETVKNTLFENQNRLKLVTPCQGEEDVIEEYLIYRLYNLVTDYSFRVRLVKVLYYDTNSEAILFERYSFFIEDRDNMDERNNATVTEKFLTPFDLDYEGYKKLSVFQFLIGNIDWYVTSRKNIIVIQPNDNSLKPVAVPYDFDFSGLVNAFYSKPRGLTDQTVSYRRRYKGICYTEEELMQVFKYFRELKPRFRAVIKNEKALSGNARIEIMDYLNYSFSLLRSRAVRKEFLKTCETRELYNIKM